MFVVEIGTSAAASMKNVPVAHSHGEPYTLFKTTPTGFVLPANI
jgi:hypothetical protein